MPPIEKPNRSTCFRPSALMKAMALAPICSNVVGTSPELLETPALAVLVERRQHLIERDFVTSNWPVAKLLVGGIGDDPVEPGAEGRLTPERVDLPDHGPERVLHDFLGVPRVSRDAAREAIRAVAVGGDEKLCCGRLPAPQCLQEKTIAIDSRRSRLTHRHSFPRLGLVYRQGEGPWQTPPDGNARIPVLRPRFSVSSRASRE